MMTTTDEWEIGYSSKLEQLLMQYVVIVHYCSLHSGGRVTLLYMNNKDVNRINKRALNYSD